MNYLAHCWIGPQGEAGLAGGIMGDLVHGPDLRHLPAELAKAIRLHRAADSFTDQHEIVLALKARFLPPYRRYAGIMLDMSFDHILARDFDRYSSESLRGFADRIYHSLSRYQACLDPALLPRLNYIMDRDLLFSYQRADAIVLALHGIGRRFRHMNPLGSCDNEFFRMLPTVVNAAPAFLALLHEFAQDWIQRQPPAA